jgi:hypothetical protein
MKPHVIILPALVLFAYPETKGIALEDMDKSLGIH